MDWLDLLAVQGTLKSLLQHHSMKVNSIRVILLFSEQSFLNLFLFSLQWVFAAAHGLSPAAVSRGFSRGLLLFCGGSAKCFVAGALRSLHFGDVGFDL